MDVLVDGLVVLLDLLLVFLNFFVGDRLVPSHQIAQLIAVLLRLFHFIGLVSGILT